MTASPALSPMPMPLPSMTVEEFLDWPGDGTGRKFQLVHGVPKAMAGGSADHGTIQGNIITAVNIHLEARGLRCRAATEAPVVPPFRPRKNARVPDVVVACSPPSDSRVYDEPLIIVEILSPSNEDETWESLSAVSGLISLQDVVVVNATRVEALVYRRGPNGRWPETPETIGPGQTLRFASIDLDLPMVRVYRNTLLAEQAGESKGA